MRIAQLLPASPSLRYQSCSRRDGQLRVLLRAAGKKAALCPLCGHKSKKVHSVYTRHISDLPWAGVPVCMEILVRKFFCANKGCSRKIFTEPLGSDMPPYARRTSRSARQLGVVGLIAGGNTGVALARTIGLPGSASSVLRQVRVWSRVETSQAPKVIGIDDWAFRKGRTYGTIVVDLETGRPIDLLPDRESASVTQWLEQHPSVKVISRDRAGAYALAAKTAAPEAMQVADRYHLLNNLGEALQRVMDKQYPALQTAARELARTKQAQPDPEKEIAKPLDPAPSGEEAQPQTITKKQANFQEVKRLRAENYPIRAIARQTGLNRQTIKKYLDCDVCPIKSVSFKNRSEVYQYTTYLKSRWDAGESNRAQLWREVVELGFSGSFQAVYRICRQFGPAQGQAVKTPALELRYWSARRVSMLLAKPCEALTQEQSIFMQALYQASPLVEKAALLSRRFKQMVTDRQHDKLDEWLQDAVGCGVEALKNFAQGLKRDYDAVENALTQPWSNGPVEGHVNRLKTIKRQMYGRAGFDLLKLRVLAVIA